MSWSSNEKNNYLIHQNYVGKVLLLSIIFAVIPSAKFSVKFGNYFLELVTEISNITSQINRKINCLN